MKTENCAGTLFCLTDIFRAVIVVGVLNPRIFYFL